VENSGEPLTLRFANQVFEGVHVFGVSGEVDFAVKEQFENALTCAVDGAHSPLVIDLTHVRYMDTTGLNALVRARVRMTARDDELYIVLPHPQLQRVFAILSFDKVFRIHQTLDNALAAARS
jgi:anti-sigma B factor antagonist